MSLQIANCLQYKHKLESLSEHDQLVLQIIKLHEHEKIIQTPRRRDPMYQY